MTRLPTNGTHLMWALDIGNVMDRSYRETFGRGRWSGTEKPGAAGCGSRRMCPGVADCRSR
ncbi:MAG: hypothetical protein Ct9H300mP1_20460 [Planctomycetaceae bacterium]|nr:MAG: hypothetical protein Ct9H300mP1_20460 [Planctomycetaceae bacterium]